MAVGEHTVYPARVENMSGPLRVIPSRVNPRAALAGWLLLTTLAGGTGAIASVDARQFYATLDQPAWAPPAGVFGPVWTLLYIGMGVAVAWRSRTSSCCWC
jgi:tryptophan-rich sensory protein